MKSMETVAQHKARLKAAASVAALALCLLTSHASAASPADIGRPVIGTPAYSAGCVITATFEDGSATAYCAEDGVSYGFDPDGRTAGPWGPARQANSWYVIP